jgi:1-acyl-sn-glycerol-3-phosphate acyltransferase
MPATASGQPSRTSCLTRLARACRLVVHIADGWLYLKLKYPHHSRVVQLDMIRRWSQRLLAILGIAVHNAGDRPAPVTQSMLVANHISWLDIFVIHAQRPVRFVSRAEVKGWPVIGTLSGVTGTMFIERVKRKDAHRINTMLVEALAEGDWIGVFPEGATTDGDVVRHFHANLLQPAIDRGIPLQPLALRYVQADGTRSTAAPYVGEQSLAESLLLILEQASITAEVRFLAPLPTQGRSRRELARLAETAIASALELPVIHTPLVSAGGPPA